MKTILKMPHVTCSHLCPQSDGLPTGVTHEQNRPTQRSQEDYDALHQGFRYQKYREFKIIKRAFKFVANKLRAVKD